MAGNNHPHRVTQADRDNVSTLHAQGVGRNAIADRTGLSLGTVTNIAKSLGLSFHRDPGVIAANESRAHRLKARRQAIQERLLARAEVMLDRLEADTWQTVLRGDSGSEHQEELAFVPVRDEKDAAWSIGSFLAQDRELEKVNGDAGEENARSMLTALMRDVQGAWALAQTQTDPQEP